MLVLSLLEGKREDGAPQRERLCAGERAGREDGPESTGLHRRESRAGEAGGGAGAGAQEGKGRLAEHDVLENLGGRARGQLLDVRVCADRTGRKQGKRAPEAALLSAAGPVQDRFSSEARVLPMRT